jgi:hypothetical protein
MTNPRLTIMVTAALLVVGSAFSIQALGQGREADVVSGKVMYKDGSQQPFTIFRCSYYSRLGHSVNEEALIADNGGKLSAVTLDKIERIDFLSQANRGVRHGTARLFDHRTLEVFFHVEQCEWANGKAARGNLKDSHISVIIFNPRMNN